MGVNHLVMSGKGWDSKGADTAFIGGGSWHQYYGGNTEVAAQLRWLSREPSEARTSDLAPKHRAPVLGSPNHTAANDERPQACFAH